LALIPDLHKPEPKKEIGFSRKETKGKSKNAKAKTLIFSLIPLPAFIYSEQ